MKIMKISLLLVVCSLSLVLFAQKPINAVIVKFNEGAAKVNAGDFKPAIADFEEVIILAEKLGDEGNDLKIKAQDQLPVLNFRLASGLIKQKKYEEAIPFLQKTIVLVDLYGNNPEYKGKALKLLPQMFTIVGSQKYKERDFLAAFRYFDEALVYDASYAKAYLGKGLIYADQLREKEMLENLGKAIELSKATADQKTIDLARTHLGAFYIRQGNNYLANINPEEEDFEPAVASFEKAISYNPDEADAYYMLAVTWNKAIEFDKAIENCNKALRYETDTTKIAAINYELGNAYFCTADYTRACEFFKKAMVGQFTEKARARKDKVPGCN